MSLYLLQVSQDVDSAVEDAFPLGGVEFMDEISGVVLMTFLIPVKKEQGRFTFTVSLGCLISSIKAQNKGIVQPKN